MVKARATAQREVGRNTVPLLLQLAMGHGRLGRETGEKALR